MPNFGLLLWEHPSCVSTRFFPCSCLLHEHCHPSIIIGICVDYQFIPVMRYSKLWKVTANLFQLTNPFGVDFFRFHFELSVSFRSGRKSFLYLARSLMKIPAKLTTPKKLCNCFLSLSTSGKLRIFSIIWSCNSIPVSSIRIPKNSILLTAIVALVS